MNRFFTVMVLLFMGLYSNCLYAQNEKNTPFDYPVAPDTCSTLESRCNYIVANFWNNFNIAKPITDDAGFNAAFRDYINFFKYAHRNIVMSSVRDFIFKARANTSNLIRVGQVAEASLYGPNAEYWSDELYIEIARLMSESTTLKNADRNYYKHQIEVIGKCVEGNVLPEMELNMQSGKSKLSSIEAEAYLVFFSDASTNSVIDRTRLSTDIGVGQLIEQGQVKVVQIFIGKPDNDWYANQPAEWVNATVERVETIDLRSVPSCYILDKDRKILTKNVSVDDVKTALN